MSERLTVASVVAKERGLIVQAIASGRKREPLGRS